MLEDIWNQLDQWCLFRSVGNNDKPINKTDSLNSKNNCKNVVIKIITIIAILVIICSVWALTMYSSWILGINFTYNINGTLSICEPHGKNYVGCFVNGMVMIITGIINIVCTLFITWPICLIIRKYQTIAKRVMISVYTLGVIIFAILLFPGVGFLLYPLTGSVDYMSCSFIDHYVYRVGNVCNFNGFSVIVTGIIIGIYLIGGIIKYSYKWRQRIITQRDSYANNV